MAELEQSRAISVRVKHVHRSKYKNQRRHDLRIGHQPAYVDGDRAHLNRVLVDLPEPAMIAEGAKDLRDRTNPARTMRTDAAVATIGIITFGLAAQTIFEALTAAEQDAAYLAIAGRIAAECGTTMRGLVVHGDETAPHAHVVWDCRDQDGVPMSRVMKGSRLQDIEAEVIARHAPGIVRGIRKADRIARGDKPSLVYNRSVKELHQDLPAEITDKQDELERLTERVDEMKARVAKLEAKEALNEKEAKRLATYRKRLADRVAEYNDARATLLARTAAVKRNEIELAEKERELAKIDDKLEAETEALLERKAVVREREAEVERREGILDRLIDDIAQMVGSIADRLGVGGSLRAIRDRLTSARDELEDEEPSLE